MILVIGEKSLAKWSWSLAAASDHVHAFIFNTKLTIQRTSHPALIFTGELRSQHVSFKQRSSYWLATPGTTNQC